MVRQFFKFACVGVLNTAIDLVVLNILLGLFRVGQNGPGYALCKAVSFTLAVVNSYLWNKYWVFKSSIGARQYEKGIFLLVSICGLVVNVLVASVAFSIITNFDLHGPSWLAANTAALIGTCTVLIFNFF